MRNSALARAMLIALFAVCTCPATAGEGRDLARKGRAVWSAFVCAALASHLNQEDEHKRLFEYGYDQGKEFIEAVRSGKITREDISKEVPVVVALSLNGPSTDFILGRIYELAVDDALDPIWGDDDAPHDRDTRQLLAQTKFDEINCGLIGQ